MTAEPKVAKIEPSDMQSDKGMFAVSCRSSKTMQVEKTYFVTIQLKANVKLYNKIFRPYNIILCAKYLAATLSRYFNPPS